MTTISKTDKKYFFVVKSTNGLWAPIMRPFVLNHNGESGQFLSSSWYKHAIPEHYECVVIKIAIDKLTSDNEKIIKCIDDLNNTKSSITALPFVVMYNIMNKKYFENVHNKLKQILNNNNDTCSSTHSSIETAAGTFSISFAKKKGLEPVMYCPAFTANKLRNHKCII